MSAPEITSYQHGILAGLADDWDNPYLDHHPDGRALPYEAERFVEGRRFGWRLRELAAPEGAAS